MRADAAEDCDAVSDSKASLVAIVGRDVDRVDRLALYTLELVIVELRWNRVFQ